MMKRIYLILLFCVSIASYAQAPQGINYQGVARNSAGSAIGMANVSVRFTILQNSSPVYVEMHAVTTDTFGLYNKVIGQGSVITGNFGSINWSAGNLTIQVEIDDLSGSGYQVVGTSQLMSVPYAMYAAASGNASAGTVTSVSVGPGLSASANPITSSGTIDLATVNAGTNTYGGASSYPVITVDQYGRVIGATTQSVTAGISSVAATPPLFVSAGTTPTVSIPAAGSASDGFLSKSDWVTFNNKFNSISIPANSGLLPAGLFSSNVTLSADTGNAVWHASFLRNTPITSTLFPVANDVLMFNGSAWTNMQLPPPLPTSSVGSLLFANSTNNWTASNPFTLFTDGTNIGMGTNNPTATLDIFSNHPQSAASINNLAGGAGLLIQTSSASNVYALKVFQAGLAQAGYFEINNSSNSSDAIYSQTNGTGNAMKGYVNGIGSGVIGWNDNQVVGGTGAGITGYSTGYGNAAVFQIQNASNAAEALKVSTTGTGYSATFGGGAGVKMDKLQITGPAAPFSGAVLVSSDNFGNANWQSLPPPLPPGTTGQLLWNNSGTWIPTNTAQLTFDGTRVGIGNPAPTSPLDVYSSTASSGVRVNSVAGGPALTALTSGGGIAVEGTAFGTGGSAGVFAISNTGNASNALVANTNGSGIALSAINQGAGRAAYFEINSNSANPSDVLYAASQGKGRAAFFQLSNSSNGSEVIYGNTQGTGNVAQFSISNPTSTADAIYVSTNGNGAAVSAYNFGGGVAIRGEINGNSNAGYFAVNSSTNNQAALFSFTNGLGNAASFNISNTGNNAPAVYASTSGTGNSGTFSGGNGLKTDGFTANVTTVPNGGIVLNGTHYYVQIPAGTTGNITLPPAGAANAGRIYVIKNLSSTAFNLQVGSTYTSAGGVPNQTNIPANTVVRLICDGGAWQAW